MTHPTADLLAAALDYAARGWPVLPLHHPIGTGPKSGPDRARCSCGRDCGAPGKHPRTAHGLDDATVEAETIRHWWERWPSSNIGLRTGVAFDVLDLDGPEALDSLDALAPPDAATITTAMAVTGRGIHMYLATTGAGNRAGIAPGIDWRGAGGYVVAPPSLHHLHGDRYSWGDGPCGIDTPIADMPAWLASIVVDRPRRKPLPPLSGSGSRYGATALDAEVGRVAVAEVGARNDTLCRAAYRLGQLVAGGQLDAQEVAGALLTVALRIGLSEGEAVATIRSGMSAGMTSPRRPEVTR